MPEIHLTNPTDAGRGVDLSGVLTIGAVGKSVVWPRGSWSWFRWSATFLRATTAAAKVW